MTTNATPLQRARPVLLELLLAAAVGACVYGVSCLFAWPKPENVSFGAEWQLMSENPLALRGLFPHRILAPFLAWTLGCGGEHYVVFVRALHIVMLALVFLYARRLGTTRFDGVLVSLAVGVTAPVQMYKWHWVGYSDPLSYSLFLLAVLSVRHTIVFWACVTASLFNHELALFLIPWLFFVKRREKAPWTLDATGVAFAVALYAAFYLFVRSRPVQHTFTYDYFAENPLLPWGAVGVWVMMTTHWLLAFGPILAVLAWHQYRPEYGRERWQLWLVVAGILGVLSIAFDWMRHANLIVFPLVLASARFLTTGHRVGYAILLGASTLFLLLHPPWTGVAEPSGELFREIHRLVLDPKPTDFSRVITEWLPAVWPTLLWIYALLGAIWTIGWWLARRDARTPPTTANRAV